MTGSRFLYSLVVRCAAGALLAVIGISGSRAEVGEVRVAYQRTLAFLPIMIMEKEKLIEAEAKKAGLDGLRVEWINFANGGAMNDALLSGGIDIAGSGTGPFLTIWSKTRRNMQVKGLAGSFSGTYDLVTNNPAIKSLKDFSDNDRIAVPAVSISIQAMILQMAVAKEFGIENFNKLDRLTVSMPQPAGVAALTSGKTEITAQLAGPPFQQIALETSGIRQVLSSKDVFQGSFTGTLMYTTAKFHDANPKVVDVFLAAQREAINRIAQDKRQAAKTFVELAASKMSADFIEKVISGPGVTYSFAPQNVLVFADFMHRTERLKDMPESWRELFFANIHDLPGS